MCVCVWVWVRGEGEDVSFIVALCASVFSCCFFSPRKIFLYVLHRFYPFVVFQSKKDLFICIH